MNYSKAKKALESLGYQLEHEDRGQEQSFYRWRVSICVPGSYRVDRLGPTKERALFLCVERRLAVTRTMGPSYEAHNAALEAVLDGPIGHGGPKHP